MTRLQCVCNQELTNCVYSPQSIISSIAAENDVITEYEAEKATAIPLTSKQIESEENLVKLGYDRLLM
jgi:hypothetical protein